MSEQKLPVGADELRTDKLPALLLDYQQKTVDMLDDPETEVLLIEKSRRIGETWGIAAYATLRAARQKGARGMDVTYISYDHEMTREFVDACAMWAKAFAYVVTDTGDFIFEDTNPQKPDETREIKAFRIRFASGFEIIALSSAPRSLRGKQAVAIIDEAAFVDALDDLFKAALAFLMWGGQVVALSSHKGVTNHFNVLVQDTLAKKTGYRHMRIDLDDALKGGLYKRICLVAGKEWSPEAEAQWRAKTIKFYGDHADEELFCIPNASSGSWLPSTLIEARSKDGIPIVRSELPANYLQLGESEQIRLTLDVRLRVALVLKSLDPERRHCLGFDFARYADLSVLWVFEVTASVDRRTVLVIELRRWPYKEQQDLAVMVLKRLPRLIGSCFDGTGAGLGLAEGVARDMGMTGVSIEMLSVGWYRENMPAVKRAFEEGTIVIPRDDDIHSDLRLVQIKEGVPQVPALRTGTTGVKRHGDAAIAAVLAWKASLATPPGLIEYYRRLALAQQEETTHG